MEVGFEFEFRRLETEGLYNLRNGNYIRAEEIFGKYLDLMLEFQNKIGRRIHKGNPYHNIGISQLFQGKAVDALRNLILAYVEDLISSDNPVEVDGAPASRVLRGLCGVAWGDLRPFENKVGELKSSGKVEERPETVYELCTKAAQLIIENYQKYLQDTWRFEVDGQRALQNSSYEQAEGIYHEWYDRLLKYQDARALRVHKGHPLAYLAFVAGRIEISKALDYFLYAYIEDILSERKIHDARGTAVYRNLKDGFGFAEAQIFELENFIRERKAKGMDQKSPEKELELFMGAHKIEPQKTDREQIAEPEATSKQLGDIDLLPGSFQTRVFIGGSHAKEETLREIAKYVAECGLTPIIAKDFRSPIEKDEKLLNDHDLDVYLITISRWAIFELSIPGAQFGEVEWAIRFLDKPTFGLRNRGAPRLSAHVEGLFSDYSVDDFFRKRKQDIFEFSKNEEIRSWLREVVFKEHCSSAIRENPSARR